MNINILIDELYNNIILQLQESKLPIAIVKLIIDNISNEIEKQYYATLNSLA